MGCIEEGQIRKRRQKVVVAAAWGTELVKFLAALAIFDLKKRINRITANNGMDALKSWMVHTIPNHHPIQKCMDVLKKIFFKSSLLLNGYYTAFKYVPTPAATTFAFPSVFILLR